MTAGNDRHPMRVAGLLLAAGESRRMGETNKLLLPVGRSRLLERSVALLAQCNLDPIVAVLGHHLEESAPIVSKAGVPFVINNQYRDGQQSSLRVGLEALGNNLDACVVLLADLPILRRDTLDTLHCAVQQSPHAEAWVPVYENAWGNPRAISQSWCRRLRADEALTSKQLFAAHRDQVATVAVDDPGVVRDIDTPEDYRAFLDELTRQGNGLH
ncbi:MAG: nucleotidyltransferase family protein [Pseudomonadota bacterium]